MREDRDDPTLRRRLAETEADNLRLREMLHGGTVAGPVAGSHLEPGSAPSHPSALAPAELRRRRAKRRRISLALLMLALGSGLAYIAGRRDVTPPDEPTGVSSPTVPRTARQGPQ